MAPVLGIVIIVWGTYLGTWTLGDRVLYGPTPRAKACNLGASPNGSMA